LGGKSNPFYIRPTNENVLPVKKILLALFTLCLTAFHGAAQGTYVNVIINGLDPICGIQSVNGSFYSGEDSTVATNVTFQMAGAMSVYGALLPTSSEAVMLTVCAQTSPNCGFVICVEQLVYANTSNTVLIDFTGGGGGGSNDADMDGYAGEADCNDNDPYSNPGMPEFCGDFADNNCDGAIDEGCGGETDNDNDGFVGVFDCNDNDASINPNATEICGDSIDNNCNSLVDEGCNEGPIDFDMDGYYSNSDCNDMDYTVNPGMLEICADAVDNNCNGVVDEEGCTGGGTEGCNPEILLVSDSAMWSETPGVVWILFPFNPSNTASFFWDFGDGNTSTEPFPTNIYDLAGTYTVCLTVMANGCVGTTCLTFTVTPEGDFLPGGMPMTGFTLNVVNAIPNNVSEVSANAVLEAYPCPFNDQLTLKVQSAQPCNAFVACYNMTGALIAQEQIVVSNQPTNYTIPTASWNAGTYTIVINTPSGTIRRVVIK
jgi:hypothetical protein